MKVLIEISEEKYNEILDGEVDYTELGDMFYDKLMDAEIVEGNEENK